jgi:spermidine synthase
MVIFYGNELVIGVVLAIWLAGISVGALLGSNLIKKFENPIKILYPLLVIFTVMQPVNIGFIRSLRLIFKINPGQIYPIGTTILSALIFLAPIGLFVGLFFPLMVRSLEKTKIEGAVTIGNVYLLEALGALFGGVVFSFILVDRYNPFFIIAINAILILLPLSLFALSDPVRSHKWLWGIISVAVLTIFIHSIASPVAAKIDRSTWEKRWKSMQLPGELELNTDSRYQNIEISSEHGQNSLYTNCKYNFSFPDPWSSAQFAHLVMSAHEKPENILIIGGGAFDLVREILKYPIDSLDYVAVDPVLISLMEEYQGGITDKRFHLNFSDGREFVKDLADSGDEIYDIIILDIPEPDTAMMNRYYTLEFYKLLSRIMKNDSFIVVQATSPVNYFGDITSRYTGAIYHTIRSVFPEIGFAPDGNIIFFASKAEGSIDISPEKLAARYNKRRIKTEYFNALLFRQLLPEERIKYTRENLVKTEDVILNHDERPSVYFLNLILWDSYSGSRLTPLLKFLYRNGTHILVPVIFLFSIIWFFRQKRRNLFNVGGGIMYIMFSTGLWSLAETLLLVMMYQSFFGYIYRDIGLMIGLFMFGLSSGTFFSTQVISDKPSINSIKALLISEFAILGLVALQILLIVLGLVSFKFIYFILIFLCGVATGAQYPFINRILIEKGMTVGRTAGMIDSMDHLGAFAGALLTNIILIPLLGITVTLILLAVLKAGGDGVFASKHLS